MTLFRGRRLLLVLVHLVLHVVQEVRRLPDLGRLIVIRPLCSLMSRPIVGLLTILLGQLSLGFLRLGIPPVSCLRLRVDFPVLMKTLRVHWVGHEGARWDALPLLLFHIQKTNLFN